MFRSNVLSIVSEISCKYWGGSTYIKPKSKGPFELFVTFGLSLT